MEYCENNFFIVFYRLKISDAKVVKSAEKTQKGGVYNVCANNLSLINRST